MKLSRRSFLKVSAAVVAVAVLIVAVYIMLNGIGLVPELDFGAGAYYYADIPDYEKVVRDDLYQARLPYWVYVILFLAWGALIYRIWKKLDK